MQGCGLTTTNDKLEALIKNLKQELSVEQVEQEIVIDMDVDLNSMDIAVYDEIVKLSPYGEGFAPPVFRSFPARVEEFQIIGDEKHTRLKIRTDSGYVSGIWWNSRLERIMPDATVVYRVGVNGFNGTRSVQLEVLNLEMSKPQADRNLEIEDMRYFPGNNPPVITGTRVGRFIEGKNVGRGEFNRYGVRLCDTLVLASAPASPKILRDIVQESYCQNWFCIRDRYPRPVIDSADESNQGRKHRQNCTLGPELPLCVNQPKVQLKKGWHCLKKAGF